MFLNKKVLLKLIMLFVLVLTNRTTLRAQSNRNDESIAPLVNGVPEKSIRGDIVPDVTAQFPGGVEALNKFLNNQSENTVQTLEKADIRNGNLIALFLIDDEGHISKIGVIKHLDPQIDQAVINILAKMPHWEPFQYRGEKITYFYKLSLNYDHGKFMVATNID